jgi:hypothetical protein
MKLVRFDDGKTGLIVRLSTGLHVIDVIASLSALAQGDPISQGILNGIFKDKGSWGPLIEHWPIARVGLKRLANTAAIDGSGVVLRRLDDVRMPAHTADADGIISLDIAEWETVAHDPTGRDVMAEQFALHALNAKPLDGRIVTLDAHRP